MKFYPTLIKHAAIILATAFFSCLAMAQTRSIDSLRVLVSKSQRDTLQLINLNKLCTKFYRLDFYDSVLLYSNKAKVLGKELLRNSDPGTHNEIKDLLNWSCYYAGHAFRGLGNYPEAIKCYFEALKYCEETNSIDDIGLNHSFIADIYSFQGKPEDALKHYLICLDINKKIGYEPNIAYDHNSIGLAYWKLNKPDEALDYFKKSHEMFTRLKDENSLAMVHGNMAIIYALKANAAMRQEKRSTADSLFDITHNHNVIALEKFTATNDHYGIANTNNNIGEFLISSGNSSLARPYLNEGLRIGKEMRFKEILKESYRNLAVLDSTTGNFKTSLKNYKLYIAYNDSLVNEENTKKTIQVQLQYDFDKKESEAKAAQDKKDALAAEENKKQAIIRNTFIAGFSLVLMLAVLIFRGYRNKQKANLIITKQKEEVEKAKSMIEQQKHLVEEKQKEILDSIYYARRIQKALITNEKYIEKKMSHLNSK